MNKSILITGASSGIGKAIAEKAAQKSFHVFATVRKKEDKKNLEALHQNIECLFVDVTNEEDLKNAYSIIKEKTDNLKAVINNAGCAFTNVIEFANIDEIKEQFEVNTFAPLMVTKIFLPLIDEGKIINISSVSSNVVYPFISPYCASKKAMDIFFRALDIEMNNPKIKIVSIKPGVVKTPIWEKSLNAAKERFEKLPQKAKDKYTPKVTALLDNMQKGVSKGIDADDTAELVIKILNNKNPRMSYNIGLGAHLGEFLSKLPDGLQNFILKHTL